MGFILSKTGISGDPAKIDAIVQCTRLCSLKDLQSFLGLIMHLINPATSTLLNPLYKLLWKDSVKFEWNLECERAFLVIKEQDKNSIFFFHFNPSLPINVKCDASTYGFGGVLFHGVDDVERPVAYISRTLNTAERWYSQIDREALAIVFTVSTFYKYLFGLKFTLWTDHWPLTFIFTQQKGLSQIVANRLQHYAFFCHHFDFKI